MSTESTKNALSVFEEAFTEIPAQMRIFSLCMRSLYAESAVGTGSTAAQKFRVLRDRTRDDAQAYLRGVMPVVTSSVSDIGDYFEYYIALDQDEWWECIDDIIEEATKHHEACKVLVKLHEQILVPLKKREDEAKVLAREMENLTAEFKKQAEKLRAEAEEKRAWAVGLAFIPFVGAIASPILGVQSDKALAEAVAKQEQATVNALATKSMSEALIPALKGFICGLEKIAGFFEIVKNELESFKKKGEDASTKKKAGEGPKILHYKFMQSKAKTIKQGCFGFYAMLPAVRTDFEAIPTAGTDENYVDRWLAAQKKLIEENCKAKGLKAMLMKAITE